MLHRGFIMLITILFVSATDDPQLALRYLQQSQMLYNYVFLSNSGIDMVGNKLLYDPASKTFVTLTAGTILGSSSLSITSFDYKGTASSPSRPSFFLKVLHGCTYKYNGSPDTRIPFLIDRVNYPTGTEDGVFIVMSNSSGPNQLPSFCNNDGTNLYLLTYSNSLFNIKASWTNIMQFGTIKANIQMIGGSTCNGCNFFEPLAGVYVPYLNRYVVLMLWTDQSQDQANLPPTPPGQTRRYFLIVSFFVDSTIPSAGPDQIVDKIVVLKDTYSSQLINVRNLKVIPGTTVVYFVYQQGSNSFMVTINSLSTPGDELLPDPPAPNSRRINLKNDVLNSVLQEQVEYDPTSRQFMQIYVKDITNIPGKPPQINFNAYFFQLNTNDYVTLGPNAFVANYYRASFNHPDLNSSQDAVKFIKMYSGYLFFCDYYYCYFSTQNNVNGLAFDMRFNLSKQSQIYNSNPTQGRAYINGISDFIENIDVRIWYYGTNLTTQGKQTQSSTFLATTEAINCPFMNHWQNKFCYIYCPLDMYILGSNTCTERCPNNLIKRSTNAKASTCINSCPFFADGNLNPMECSSLTYCNYLSVPKNTFPNQDYYICISTCPPGTKQGTDDNSKSCLGCTSSEGYSYKGNCVKTCPQYTVTYSSPNICQNCKDINKYYYNASCYDTIYPGTTLASADFNAYVLCKDIGNVSINNACADSCPINNYPLDSDKNTCVALAAPYYVKDGYLVKTCGAGYGYGTDRVCYKCRDRLKFYYEDNCISACPDNYFYDGNSICYRCGTNGDWSDNLNYVEKCTTPICPDYAPLNYQTKKCMFCNLTAQYWVNGQCEDSCPVFAAVDIYKSKCDDCLGNGDVYYKNECYSVCPEGTKDKGYGYCEDINLSCSDSLCNNKGTCYIDGAGRQKCTCQYQDQTGQFCQLNLHYMSNFYTNFTGELFALTSNYSFFSSINTNVKNVTNSTLDWISSNVLWLENNHPNYSTIFDDLSIELIAFLGQYNTVMGSLGQQPILEIYDFYDFMLNVTVREVDFLKSKKNQTLRMLSQVNITESLTNFRYAFEKIKAQLPQLTSTTSLMKSVNNLNAEMKLNYSNFYITSYNSTQTSLKKFMQYSLDTSLSYVEFSDCEEYLRKQYNTTYFLINKVDWRNKYIIYDLDDNITNVDPRMLIDFNLIEPKTGKVINLANECSSKARYYKYRMNNVTDYSFEKYYFYKESNVNYYDFNSKFYNDRCFIYVSNNLDVTLDYRRTVLAPDLMVSCAGCTFIGIDYFNYTVCECTNESEQRVDIVKNNFTYPGSNLPIIKCLGQIIGISQILNNIGFWFGICIFFLILTTIMFIRVLYRRELYNYIDSIIYNDANYFYEDILPLPNSDMDLEVRKAPIGNFQ
jgi:hypothetical protein